METASRTASVVPAGRDEVYAFLSKTENVPEWATEFVRELKVVGGKHKAVTPAGKQFFRVEGNPRTGVVDTFAGPSEEAMAVFPGRVVALPNRGTAFLFTMFKPPGLSEDEFEALKREVANVGRKFARP